MADTGFTRPTLAALVERISSDLNSRLQAAGFNENAFVRRSTNWVLARVIAGASHLMLGFLDYIAKQLFPDLAAEIMLARHSALRGITRTPAVACQITGTFTGTPSTSIPSGTAVQFTGADGVTYTFTTDSTDTVGGGGDVDIPCTASTAGASATPDAGAALTLTTPIAGVDSEVTVDTVDVEGADIESVSSWRDRILQRWAEEPQGGAETDYEQWAKEVSGVGDVYVYPNELGAGTVVVRFTAEVPEGGDSTDLVPSGAKVTEVETYLQDTSRRPVTADVSVPTLTADPIAFTISARDVNGDPVSATVQAAITAELHEMFIRLSEPGGTIQESKYREAISAAEGEDYHTVTVPAGDITASSSDHLMVLGAMTWT